MKTKYLLLSTLLTIALTLPTFGRDNLSDTTSMMGNPTADATVGGIHIKVWLMTQEQHNEMMMPAEKGGEMGRMEMTGIDHANMTMARDMKGMPQDSMGMKATGMRMDNDTVEAIQGSRSMNTAITASTHHIVLDVTEIASGKEISGASARLLIESPSKKSSSVDLKSTMEHFEGALTLNEKGEYRFTVNVSFGGATKTTQFQYAVK
jgi:hypothetical protein